MMEKVGLGMPGAWAEDECEVADHYTTKIGGLPDWPTPNIGIRSDLLECLICRSKLCLVAQVYAPISNPTLKIDERVIYIFSCVKPSCGTTPQSWRVLRLQKSPSNGETNNPVQVSLPTASISDSNSKLKNDSLTFDYKEGDDGSDSDIDLEELGRRFSEAATVASHSEKKHHEPETNNDAAPSRPTRIIDEKVPVLPCFYISIQPEKVSREISVTYTKPAYIPPKENESDSDQSQPETWDEEGYEYDRALNADRTYLKFMKRLDLYPEQCFRYSFGGMPLLATKEAKESGTCSLCGKSRHYELQLMAPLIYFLQETTDDRQRSYVENWDWITLIVYTCSESCFDSSEQEKSDCEGWNVAEEAIIIQRE